MKPEFNQHIMPNSLGFTIEFNVKNPVYPEGTATWFNGNDEIFQEFGLAFVLDYGDACFNEITKYHTFKYFTIEDWTILGRSGGWFALECNGNLTTIRQSTLDRITKIVKKYFINFSDNILIYKAHGKQGKFEFNR